MPPARSLRPRTLVAPLRRSTERLAFDASLIAVHVSACLFSPFTSICMTLPTPNYPNIVSILRLRKPPSPIPLPGLFLDESELASFPRLTPLIESAHPFERFPPIYRSTVSPPLSTVFPPFLYRPYPCLLILI